MQEVQAVINLIILLFPFSCSKFSTRNVIQEPSYVYLLIFLFIFFIQIKKFIIEFLNQCSKNTN
jgi:hypothetical protein